VQNTDEIRARFPAFFSPTTRRCGVPLRLIPRGSVSVTPPISVSKIASCGRGKEKKNVQVLEDKNLVEKVQPAPPCTRWREFKRKRAKKNTVGCNLPLSRSKNRNIGKYGTGSPRDVGVGAHKKLTSAHVLSKASTPITRMTTALPRNLTNKRTDRRTLRHPAAAHTFTVKSPKI